MRKNILVIVIAVLAAVNVYAFDFIPSWQAGELFLGGDFSQQENQSVLSANLLDISLIDNKTGFGIILSPFNVQGVINTDESLITFVNATVFWNVFNNSIFFDLSPYTTVNWLSPASVSTYSIEAGIQFLFFAYRVKFPSENVPLIARVVRVKTGARLHSGKLSCFAVIGIDLTGLMYIIAKTKYDAVR